MSSHLLIKSTLRIHKHSTDYKKPSMSARQLMESPLRSPFCNLPVN